MELTKVDAEGLGAKCLSCDFNFGLKHQRQRGLSLPCDYVSVQEPSNIEIVIWIDAKSTSSVVSKQGFGKRMRHLEVAHLWLQDFLSHRLEVEKIPGTGNPANICTKHVDRSSLLKQFFETSLFYVVCTAAICIEKVCFVFTAGLQFMAEGRKAVTSSPNTGGASSSSMEVRTQSV